MTSPRLRKALEAWAGSWYLRHRSYSPLAPETELLAAWEAEPTVVKDSGEEVLRDAVIDAAREWYAQGGDGGAPLPSEQVLSEAVEALERAEKL